MEMLSIIEKLHIKMFTSFLNNSLVERDKGPFKRTFNACKQGFYFYNKHLLCRFSIFIRILY